MISVRLNLNPVYTTQAPTPSPHLAVHSWDSFPFGALHLLTEKVSALSLCGSNLNWVFLQSKTSEKVGFIPNLYKKGFFKKTPQVP